MYHNAVLPRLCIFNTWKGRSEALILPSQYYWRNLQFRHWQCSLSLCFFLEIECKILVLAKHFAIAAMYGLHAFQIVLFSLLSFLLHAITAMWELYSFPAINCGDPGTPSNGQRSLSNTTYNSVVTYTCDVGHTLQGSNSRTCQSDGQWSGSLPQCNGKSTRATKGLCPLQ